MRDGKAVSVTFTERELARSIAGLADVLQWLHGFRAAMPSDSNIQLPGDWHALREINLKLKAAEEIVTGQNERAIERAAVLLLDVEKAERKAEELEAISIKHHTRALEAECKVEGYHKSLTAHRTELEARKVKNLPALPPTFDDDSIPF